MLVVSLESPNRKTAETVAAVEASGLTPLAYMISILVDDEQPPHIRMDAAKSAAPYVHAKLSSVEVAGKNGGPVETVHTVQWVVSDK